MTVQEAIEILKNPIEYAKISNIDDEEEIAYSTDFVKSIEIAIESMEKQIPKKPIYQPHRNGIMVTNYKCPVCGCRRLGHGINLDKCYCPECGQAIDWEEGAE